MTRIPRVALTVAALALAAATVAAAPRQATPAREGGAPSAAELAAAIGALGDFDYDTRTAAARTVRRAPAPVAAEALARAVREHDDEYVRYRALVLLAGLGESAAAPLMRDAITDRNDRIRTVAYGWFEHHPDPAVLPALFQALDREGSEFTRPALTRAVAAHGADPRAREALVPLVLRGEDFFRGAAIEALGDYGRTYAIAEISQVARLDGPLQDDAITALGRLGQPESVDLLVALQREVPRERQPTVSASLCLLGRNCETHYRFIVESMEFGAANEGQQPLLRGATHALGMLALAGREAALAALFDAGVPSRDPARSPIALGVGLVALRNPDLLLRVLDGYRDRDGAIILLRDAFDMLSEDFEEERFYVHVRRAFWAAPEGSPRRTLTEALIQRLDF